MKKGFCVLLCTFMIVVAFTGCSQAVSPAEIKAEYLVMLQEPVSAKSISDIGEFLDQNLNVFVEEHADQMVIAYEDYIFALNNEYPDYREFLARYESYISSALAELYEIKIEEQEHPAVIDNMLQKSSRQLCERALSLEVFIKNAANHQIVQEEASRIYEYYIRLMLMGVAGTPIFNDEGKFNTDAKDVYIEFEMLYPDTTISEVIREFIAYMESIDYSLDFENIEENKAFSDMCSYLVSEARKRVLL